MADITNQRLGTGATMGLGHGRVEVLTHVVDIQKAVADGLTTGDYVEILTLEAGTILLSMDAEITTALSLGTNNTIDIGSTVADPDEYIDASTTTAVGRFGAYVAACVVPVVLTTDTVMYCEVNGDTLASGKIATTWVVVRPAKNAVGLAKAPTATNV